MSMNYNASSQNDPSTAESDTLFAATPIWERNNKKRRGAKAASVAAPAATRESFADTAPTADQLAAREMRAERLRTEPMIGPGAASAADAPLTGSTATMSADSPVYANRTRTTTARKGAGMAPLAVAAGVLVLGGLAAAGWYATRDDGVTELTPGGTATSTAALETAPMTPAAAPTEMAANTAAPPAASRTTTTTVRTEAPVTRRTTTTTTRVRTRPAPASSAAEAGVNTAATLPGAPVPYASSADGAAAPATVNPAPIAPTASPVEPATGPSVSSATPSQPSAAPSPSTFPFQATPPVTSDTTP